jgi:hypothetical protein
VRNCKFPTEPPYLSFSVSLLSPSSQSPVGKGEKNNNKQTTTTKQIKRGNVKGEEVKRMSIYSLRCGMRSRNRTMP